MSEKKIPRRNEKATYLTFLVGINKEKVRVKVKENGIIIGRTTKKKAVDLDTKPFNGDRLGVSRQHALIAPKNDYFYVQDLESVNSTWLNKVRLRPMEEVDLYHGDLLHLGECRLEVYFTYEDEVLDALGATEVFDAEPPQANEEVAEKPLVADKVQTGLLSDKPISPTEDDKAVKPKVEADVPNNAKADSDGKTGLLSNFPKIPKDAIKDVKEETSSDKVGNSKTDKDGKTGLLSDLTDEPKDADPS